MHKMVDQKLSDFYIDFTVVLCAPNLFLRLFSYILKLAPNEFTESPCLIESNMISNSKVISVSYSSEHRKTRGKHDTNVRSLLVGHLLS